MTATESETLNALYLSDETAWLETMADLIAQKDFSELDYENLREYLTDMARRDRREVSRRLIILFLHHLKWQAQPECRSATWRSTIEEQRDELTEILESGALLNHAEDVLQKAYRSAVRRAAIETGFAEPTFPANSKLKAIEWVTLPVPA